MHCCSLLEAQWPLDLNWPGAYEIIRSRFGKTWLTLIVSGVLCSFTSSKLNVPVPLLIISAVNLRRYLVLGLNLPTIQVSYWIDLSPVVVSVKIFAQKASFNSWSGAAKPAGNVQSFNYFTPPFKYNNFMQ